MITNLIIALALIASAIYYFNNSSEIEDKVTTVLVNSLQDANNSLAEQEATRK